MDANIFALASAWSTKYLAARVPYHYNNGRSNLRLLDYIALLLVTSDKGDVAAVAIDQRPKSVVFLYSKNEPCPPQIGEYLQRLTTICASAEEGDFCDVFLTEVVQTCWLKIRNRLLKCKKAIRTAGDIKLDDKFGASAENGDSFAKTAADFFKSLLEYDMAPHKKGGVHATIMMSMGAYCLGYAYGLPQYPMLQRRIQKLGDYWGAAVFFRAMLFNNRRYAHLRGSIFTREIKPPQPKVVEVTGDVLKILNDHAKKMGHENVEAVGPSQRFKYPVQENARFQKVTVSSHCELTLASHFYERMTCSKNLMEIGISKGCCWLCEQYLSTLSRQDKRMVVEVSKYQREIHPGWGMPEKTPSSVAETMLQIIDRQLFDIRENARYHSMMSHSFSEAEAELLRFYQDYPDHDS